ncbi:MAG: pilus assembly protein PilM [Rickettsiales bacterium]|nr:pilus assembly protein PilM [Rickettsiales bacterium]
MQTPLKSSPVNNQRNPNSQASSTANSSASKNKKAKIKLPAFLEKTNEYLKNNFCDETEIIGLDIQPSGIKLCQARENKGVWQIVKLAEQQVLNTSSQDALTKNKKVYVKSLKEIFSKNKINNKNVAIAIPASIAIIKTIQLPLMSRENLDRATRIPSFWQNLVQLSENISEYLIYYRIIKEIPEKKEMEVLFVACKNEDLKIYRSIIEEANLNLVVVDVGCFSINNLSKLKKAEDSQQKVFLKIGKDENYLQVLKDAKPIIFDIFVPENEKIYINEFLQDASFSQRFSSQLKHIISKYEESGEKISEIQVISAEANIENFIELLKPKFENISLKNADLFKNIEFPHKLSSQENLSQNNSGWAISAGLATRKLDIFVDENSQNVSEAINLLPDSSALIENLRAKFYSKIIFTFSVIFSLGFLLIFSGISYINYHSSIREITEFNRLNKIYQEKQKQFNEISQKSGTLNKLVKIKDSINLNQPILINAIQEISSNIPEGVWLEQVDFIEAGKIIILGKSYEEQPVINFSRILDKSEILLGMYISNIKLINLENGGYVREFSIQGEVKK